jgi:hypothetical protein
MKREHVLFVGFLVVGGGIVIADRLTRTEKAPPPAPEARLEGRTFFTGLIKKPYAERMQGVVAATAQADRDVAEGMAATKDPSAGIGVVPTLRRAKEAAIFQQALKDLKEADRLLCRADTPASCDLSAQFAQDLFFAEEARQAISDQKGQSTPAQDAAVARGEKAAASMAGLAAAASSAKVK